MAHPDRRLDAEERQIDAMQRGVDGRRPHQARVVLEVVEDDRDEHQRRPVAQSPQRFVAEASAQRVNDEDSRGDEPRQQHRRQAQHVVRAEEAADDGERRRAQEAQCDVGTERGQKAGLIVSSDGNGANGHRHGGMIDRTLLRVHFLTFLNNL